MSLKPAGIGPVPEETARVARAAYPKGNVYLKMRDELGTIYDDAAFAHLFPNNGQPAEAPWRLALVTIMQFAEGLSDRQAADAVRGRLDWKYALGLELSDPGFDASVLSEFRTRLMTGQAEEQLLTAMLTLWKRARLAESTRSTADGFHACVGQNPRDQPTRVCRGNGAPRVELPGHRGPRMAVHSQPARVGGSLRSSAGRLAAARWRSRAASLGGTGRAGWEHAAQRHVRCQRSSMVARSAGGGDLTPGVGAELPMD